MTRLSRIFAFAAVAGLGACLLAFASRPSSYKADPSLLQFGSGGGFTGHRTIYTLERNGTLSLINTLNQDTTSMPSLKRREAKRFHKAAEALGLPDTTINLPGNMYRFIRYKSAKGSFDITWGTPGTTPPSGVEALYDSLMASMPRRP